MDLIQLSRGNTSRVILILNITKLYIHLGWNSRLICMYQNVVTLFHHCCCFKIDRGVLTRIFPPHRVDCGVFTSIYMLSTVCTTKTVQQLATAELALKSRDDLEKFILGENNWLLSQEWTGLDDDIKAPRFRGDARNPKNVNLSSSKADVSSSSSSSPLTGLVNSKRSSSNQLGHDSSSSLTFTKKGPRNLLESTKNSSHPKRRTSVKERSVKARKKVRVEDVGATPHTFDEPPYHDESQMKDLPKGSNQDRIDIVNHKGKYFSDSATTPTPQPGLGPPRRAAPRRSKRRLRSPTSKFPPLNENTTLRIKRKSKGETNLNLQDQGVENVAETDMNAANIHNKKMKTRSGRLVKKPEHFDRYLVNV